MDPKREPFMHGWDRARREPEPVLLYTPGAVVDLLVLAAGSRMRIRGKIITAAGPSRRSVEVVPIGLDENGTSREIGPHERAPTNRARRFQVDNRRYHRGGPSSPLRPGPLHRPGYGSHGGLVRTLEDRPERLASQLPSAVRGPRGAPRRMASRPLLGGLG